MKRLAGLLFACGIAACSASEGSPDSSADSTEAISGLAVRGHALNIREEK